MNQQRHEMLSALFDEQTSAFETRRLLADMTDADIQQMRRYQLMRDACRKQLGQYHCSMDISAAVSAAIADEATPAMPKTASVARVKPLLGFAAAASIAFVAVLGVQQWRHLDDAIGTGFVADGNVSASQLPIAGSPGLSTASGVSTLPLGRSAVTQAPANQVELHYVVELPVVQQAVDEEVKPESTTAHQ